MMATATTRSMRPLRPPNKFGYVLSQLSASHRTVDKSSTPFSIGAHHNAVTRIVPTTSHSHADAGSQQQPTDSVLTSSRDGMIRRWDLSGTVPSLDYILAEHTHWVNDIAVIPHASADVVLSCSSDRFIKVWSVPREEVASTHKGRVPRRQAARRAAHHGRPHCDSTASGAQCNTDDAVYWGEGGDARDEPLQYDADPVRAARRCSSRSSNSSLHNAHASTRRSHKAGDSYFTAGLNWDTAQQLEPAQQSRINNYKHSDHCGANSNSTAPAAPQQLTTSSSSTTTTIDYSNYDDRSSTTAGTYTPATSKINVKDKQRNSHGAVKWTRDAAADTQSRHNSFNKVHYDSDQLHKKYTAERPNGECPKLNTTIGTFAAWTGLPRCYGSTHSFHFHSDVCTAVAYAHTLPSQAAVCGLDGMVCVFDLQMACPKLQFSRAGRLATTSASRGRFGQRSSYFKPETVWKDHSVWCADVCSYGNFLTFGDSAGNVHGWDLRDGSQVFELPSHAGVVRDVKVNADLYEIVSVSSDKTVRIWDLRVCGHARSTLSVHEDSIWALDASTTHGGSYYTAGKDGLIFMHTSNTGKSVLLATTHQPITAISEGVAKEDDVSTRRLWVAFANSDVRLMSFPTPTSRTRAHRHTYINGDTRDDDNTRGLATLHSSTTDTASYVPQQHDQHMYNNTPPEPTTSTRYFPKPIGRSATAHDSDTQPRSTALPSKRTSDADHTTDTDKAAACDISGKRIGVSTLWQLPGVPRLCEVRVLDTQLHALTKNIDSDVTLWNLLKSEPVATFGKVNFDDAFLGLRSMCGIPQWFTCDVVLGALRITLDGDSVFNAHILPSELAAYCSLRVMPPPHSTTPTATAPPTPATTTTAGGRRRSSTGRPRRDDPSAVPYCLPASPSSTGTPEHCLLVVEDSMSQSDTGTPPAAVNESSPNNTANDAVNIGEILLRELFRHFTGNRHSAVDHPTKQFAAQRGNASPYRGVLIDLIPELTPLTTVFSMDSALDSIHSVVLNPRLAAAQLALPFFSLLGDPSFTDAATRQGQLPQFVGKFLENQNSISDLLPAIGSVEFALLPAAHSRLPSMGDHAKRLTTRRSTKILKVMQYILSKVPYEFEEPPTQTNVGSGSLGRSTSSTGSSSSVTTTSTLVQGLLRRGKTSPSEFSPSKRSSSMGKSRVWNGSSTGSPRSSTKGVGAELYITVQCRGYVLDAQWSLGAVKEHIWKANKVPVVLHYEASRTLKPQPSSKLTTSQSGRTPPTRQQSTKQQQSSSSSLGCLKL